MASITSVPSATVEPASRRRAATQAGPWDALLVPLASLRITVFLFALSIVLVLIGTLAQVESDIWEVVNRYFRSWWCMVPFRIFLPRTWFPTTPPLPGAFPFPGGKALGAALAVNLVAAHLIRFKIQAKGPSLYLGAVITVLGAMLTTLVISAGHNPSGVQDELPLSVDQQWGAMRWTVIAAAIFLGPGWFWWLDRQNASARWSWILAAVVLIPAGVWALWQGSTSPFSQASMRILWQLAQATFAGIVLLVGCILLFRKRGGIVLLHSGIALLMFYEFYVDQYAVEGQMTIVEGESTNFARDIRTTELVLIDQSAADRDRVLSIPRGLLRSNKRIIDERLPVDLQVEKYIANSMLVPPESSTTQNESAELVDNLASTGLGTRARVVELRSATGVDSEQGVDMASAYVTAYRKGTDEKLGTFLLSQERGLIDKYETLSVDGKDWGLALRFKRMYKPYEVTLVDVRKDDYVGTNIPMNYSSDVRLVDPSRDTNREVHIWMNNPLRYAGETFYQSNYFRNPATGKESTTLQVVTNTGWMMPYVSCMLVMLGMLTQFLVVLVRYLGRRSRGADPSVGMGAKGVSLPESLAANPAFAGLAAATAGSADAAPELTEGGAPRADRSPGRRGKSRRGPAAVGTGSAGTGSTGSVAGLSDRGSGATNMPAWIFTLALLLLLAGMLISKSRPREIVHQGLRLDLLGRVPVVYEGRIKPLDSLARNMLARIADSQTFKDPDDKAQPAIRWLADAISGNGQDRDHRVIRITNLEVLDTLGLKRRKGFRYSLNEVIGDQEKFEAFLRQVDEASELKRAQKLPASFYQEKLLELDGRLRAYQLVMAAFRPMDFPVVPSVEEIRADKDAASAKFSQIIALLKEIPLRDEQLLAMHPPLVVYNPDAKESEGEKSWLPFAVAVNRAYQQNFTEFVSQLTGEPNPTPAKPLPGTVAWGEMLAAYGSGNVKEFNSAVQEYLAEVEGRHLAESVTSKLGFEYRLEQTQPFFWCMATYLIALLLAVMGWIVWPVGFHRSAFWLLLLAVAVHSFALVARIYISGRPPITNLYSAAVFVGWGCAVLGLVLELVSGLGLGTILAGSMGFASLVIAQGLSMRGDTMAVLQAVLDTQFWLATHVVCVTSGYSATFAAGGLGALFIGIMAARLFWGKKLSARWDIAYEWLPSVIYGVLCFALLLSFVGTVLGGLWADDSWGRFWGWDPKENGALIIVLWNALILHARWGGMVRGPGMAILAVAGNITTTWSMFGVNELGVGLHAYGVTEGTLKNLAIFCLSQLCLIGVGIAFWWVQRGRAVSRTQLA